jgi:Zn-dependent protease
MFGPRFKLFKLFGFQVNVDLSWTVVFVLLSWTFAVNWFPQARPGLGTGTYWAMGVVTALLMFLSIVLHEVSHAMVARRFGLPIRGITLFIFGGVAEMTEEPPTAKSEFLVAIAGPIASIVIGGFCLALWAAGQVGGWPGPVVSIAGVLAWINVTLVIFNMVPAFPLDGGRVLRSVLWQWKGNLRWATRVTSGIGSAFGTALIIFGVVNFIATRGDFSGAWMALVGFFLRNAARLSYQQLLLRTALEGEPVARFMKTDPVTVPRHLSVRELVDDYFLRHTHKLYPVVEGDRLVGCVTTADIKRLPREEWDRQTVGAIAQRQCEENTIAPTTDAMAALAAMSRGRASRLMVVDGDRLVGILTLKDLLEFFSLKMELEEAR